MPDLTFPAVLLFCGGLLALGLWRFGTFTPPAVRAWTKIGHHHNLTDERPLDERLADHVPSLARVFRETSVPRLLSIAQRRENLTTWLLRLAIYVLLVAVALLTADFVIGLSQHTLPVP